MKPSATKPGGQTEESLEEPGQCWKFGQVILSGYFLYQRSPFALAIATTEKVIGVT
jgi:hypothetical protein